MNQADLFEQRSPLTWFYDETLFSLCSRHHQLSGNILAATTCKQLFDHPTQGAAHDFPSRVDRFVTRTFGHFGNAEQIIRQHTILPFFLPFSSTESSALALDAMRGASIGSLKFQLGMLTSRFRANHPLKACWQCLHCDREALSTSYWHLSHQLPGVCVCLKHGTILVPSGVKSNGIMRFQWVLPGAAQLPAPPTAIEVSDEVLTIAKNSQYLASLPPTTHFDRIRVTQVFRAGLRNQGLISGGHKGQLDTKEVGSGYAKFVSSLRQFDDFAALPSSEIDAANEVAKMVSENKGGTHPIRYLAIIGWLFGDLRSFIDQYTSSDRFDNNKPICSVVDHGPNLDKRTIFINLVNAGQSVSGAGRHIGIDPATAMSWAADAGIKVDKRPSIIKGEVREKMISALRRGSAKSVAAKVGKVSEVSVTRLLRTEVGLYELWKSARFRKAQLIARKKWSRLIDANPNSGVKAIRLLAPATYAWLYRCDRDWLNEKAEQTFRPARIGGLSVDWSQRDHALAQQVTEVSIELIVAAKGRRVKLWQIYQRIPQLRAKLSSLDKLPETRDAIQRALRSTSGDTTLFTEE